jgi:hypothetical protein
LLSDVAVGGGDSVQQKMTGTPPVSTGANQKSCIGGTPSLTGQTSAWPFVKVNVYLSGIEMLQRCELRRDAGKSSQ